MTICNRRCFCRIDNQVSEEKENCNIKSIIARERVQGREIGVTPSKYEGLLDELQGYVGSIDIADELHSIRGLGALIASMNNTHAGIRAKTAEVVSAMLHHNSTGQKLVMELGGLSFLLEKFTGDPDATANIKALRAISALFRNNESAIALFRRRTGFAGLKYGLNCVLFLKGELSTSFSAFYMNTVQSAT